MSSAHLQFKLDSVIYVGLLSCTKHDIVVPIPHLYISFQMKFIELNFKIQNIKTVPVHHSIHHPNISHPTLFPATFFYEIWN
jgi:hypothetical protein